MSYVEKWIRQKINIDKVKDGDIPDSGTKLPFEIVSADFKDYYDDGDIYPVIEFSNYPENYAFDVSVNYKYDGKEITKRGVVYVGSNEYTYSTQFDDDEWIEDNKLILDFDDIWDDEFEGFNSFAVNEVFPADFPLANVVGSQRRILNRFGEEPKVTKTIWAQRSDNWNIFVEINYEGDICNRDMELRFKYNKQDGVEHTFEETINFYLDRTNGSLSLSFETENSLSAYGNAYGSYTDIYLPEEVVKVWDIEAHFVKTDLQNEIDTKISTVKTDLQNEINPRIDLINNNLMKPMKCLCWSKGGDNGVIQFRHADSPDFIIITMKDMRGQSNDGITLYWTITVDCNEHTLSYDDEALDNAGLGGIDLVLSWDEPATINGFPLGSINTSIEIADAIAYKVVNDA